MVRFLRQLVRIVRRPSDAWLALHIGVFILRAPKLIASSDLRSVMSGLRVDRSILRVPRASRERIVYLRGWWLEKAFFRKYDTCYVRAMTLYHFLDAPHHQVRMHLGIEHRERLEERLRGHAWVTLGGTLLEGPPIVLEGRIREIPIAQ